LAALGYKNPRQAIKDLKINQKYMKKIEELYGGRNPPLHQIFVLDHRLKY
jgi:hypothetical protein